METKIKTEEKKKELNEFGRPKLNNSVVTIRIFQAIFMSVFAFGIASMGGDYAAFVQSPVSILSVTASIFGLLGTIMTEVYARMAAKW